MLLLARAHRDILNDVAGEVDVAGASAGDVGAEVGIVADSRRGARRSDGGDVVAEGLNLLAGAPAAAAEGRQLIASASKP